ncbi:DUF4347 domain-containing protein [Aquicoccus sp. SCR17]|nr:DUF4347 domain-containing protein [Carideicomes alvinocaridis]
MVKLAEKMARIAFVDGAASDLVGLAELLAPECETVVIARGRDPLEAIAERLAGRDDLASIHVFSHGAPGALRFGTHDIDAGHLPHYADTLAAIGAAGADLLLYGCRTGAGEAGRDFVARLAELTGTSVAASEAPVGAETLGGSWDLSVTAGAPRATALALPEFEGLLSSGILSNKYVKFGYSDDGTLGVGGTTKPGIQYDPDGTRNFLDTADSLTPGSPFEGFTVGVGGTTYTENNYDGGSARQGTYILSTDLTTEGSDTYGSVTFRTERGGLIIDQTYSLASPDSKVITMSVTMTNATDGTIYDVSYSRFTDPDVDSNGLPGSTSSTYNQRGADGIDGEDIVLATGPVSDRVIGLYSDSTFTHNTAVTGWTQDTASYLAGGNVGTSGDNTIGIGFDLGDFSAGTSKTFSFAYVFAANATELGDSVAEVPPSNAAPTLADIPVVDSTDEDSQVEITFAELTGQADEADSDGTVDGFMVTAVTNGTLLIGETLETATAWTVGSNDVINATLKAYWTPGADSNGAIDAFSVVAVDDQGAVSAPAVAVPVTVNAVNDRIELATDVVSLPQTWEDSDSHAGQSIADMLTPIASDADAGDTLAGIAITGDATAGEGAWQYSLDGGETWIAVPEVSPEAALVLGASASLRFVPGPDYNGTVPALTAYALDTTYAGGLTDGLGAVFTDASAPASDGPFSATPVAITGDVAAVNDAPVFTSTITPVTLAETGAEDGTLADLGLTGSLTQALTATDVDSEETNFSIRGGTLTDGVWVLEGRYGTLSLDTATNQWSYAPGHWDAINALSEGQTAIDSFVLRVTDEQGASSTQTLDISIEGANDAPVLSAALEDQSFEGDGSWTYQVPAATIFDAEGTGLTYTATLAGGESLPEWLTFYEESRTFTGNPPAEWGDVPLEIRVTATDAEGASVSDSFTLTLSGTGNQPPVVDNPLAWAAVDAPSEVTQVTLAGMLGGQLLSFDNITSSPGTTADAATVAAAAETAVNGDAGAAYSASASGGVLTLTADATGARSDFTDGATIDIDGGSYSVTILQDGVDEVAEQVAVQFAPVAGAETLSFDGQTIDISGLTASEIASAVAAAVNGSGDWNAVVDGTQTDTVNFTARTAEARADLSADDFEVATATIASNVELVTDGGNYDIEPTLTFDLTDTEAQAAGTLSFTYGDSATPFSLDVTGATSGAHMASLLNPELPAGYSAAYDTDTEQLIITGASGDDFSAPSLTSELVPPQDVATASASNDHSETLPTITFDLAYNDTLGVHRVIFTSSEGELNFLLDEENQGVDMADELQRQPGFGDAGFNAVYDTDTEQLIITGRADETLSAAKVVDTGDQPLQTNTVYTGYSETPSTIEFTIDDSDVAAAATLTLTLEGGETIEVDISGESTAAALTVLANAEDGVSASYSGGVLTITMESDYAGDPSFTSGVLQTAPVPSTEIDDTPEITSGTYEEHEEALITFADANGSTSITFDGVTVPLDGTETAIEVAAAFAAGDFLDWEVTNNGDGTVTVIAGVSESRTNLLTSDFVNTLPLANVKVTEQGVDGVTEVVDLDFTGSYGGATFTLAGTEVTAGDSVTGAQLAEALAGDAGLFGGFDNYEVVSVTGDTMVVRAKVPGDQPDLTADAFVITSDGTAEPVSDITVTTQGAGWSYEIPAGTFSDPEGDTLAYTAWTVTTDPETGEQSYALIDGTDPALVFDAETMTLSGDGTAPSDTVIEIRAYDAVSDGTAASQFQLVVYNDAAEGALVAGVMPSSVTFTDGAGEGSYTVPASAFGYTAESDGGLTYSAALAGGDPLPEWLSFDSETGTFTGNPPAGAEGNVAVNVTAIDGGSLSARVYFDLVVSGEANDPIELISGGLPDIAAGSVGEGGAVSVVFSKPFIDPDAPEAGTPSTDGITYAAFVQTEAGPVAVSEYGLTLAEDPENAGQLILSGDLAGEFASLDIVIEGTETNGGSTAETSFTLSLSDTSDSGEDIAAWTGNTPGSIALTGDATEDAVLTATVPTDVDGVAPEDVTYQWQVEIDGEWTDIIGEAGRGTGQSITLGDEEAGRNVRVQAFYTDAGGASEVVTSDATAVANVDDEGGIAIGLSGVTIGSVWTSTLTDADGLTGVAPTYQWQRAASVDGPYENIEGATYGSYTLEDADGGMFLRVVSGYTDDQGTTATVTSDPREVALGAIAPLAADDAASITEDSGTDNATPGTAMPYEGNLLDNDADENEGDVLSITSLRAGDREGIGRPAAVVDGQLVITGLYGTLSVDMETGAYSYELDQDNPAVEALGAESAPLVEAFNYTVTDLAVLSDDAVLRISINGANDLPEISGVTTAATVTEDSATRLDLLDTIVLGDADSSEVSFTLQVTSGTLAIAGVPAEVLSTAGITVEGNNTGTLTFSGVSADTLSGWLIDNGVYFTSAPNQAGETAELSYVLADEDGSTLSGETTTITASAVNDAPVVDAGGTTFQQGDAETPASALLTFLPTGSDATIVFDGVTLEIAAGSTAAEIAAQFAAAGFDGWTATDLGQGMVGLTADTNGTRAPLTAEDFTDGTGAASDLVLTGAGNDHDVRFSARGEAVLIAPDLEVSDIDGGLIGSATISMTEGVFDNQFGTDYETLSLSAAAQAAADAAGLTVSIETGATGSVVTITGLASPGAYQEVLRGVTYDNTNPNAYVDTREAVITLTDADGQVSNAASVALQEGNDAIEVGQRIFIDGVDTGATVASVEDAMHFTASTPLEGVTEGATLSFLTGDSVVTTASAEAAHSATVSIGVVWAPVIDMNGTLAGTDHLVSYVEQAPSVAVATSDARILDQDGLTRTLTLTLENPLDNDGETTLESLSVSQAVLDWLAPRGIELGETDGTMVDGALTGATYVTFEAADGASSTNFQVALRGVRYANMDDDPDTTPRVIRVTSVDTDGNEGLEATSTITPVAVNDAPVGIDSLVTGAEDNSYVFAAGDFGFSDPLDGGDHGLASVILSSLPGSGALLLDGVAVTEGTEVTLAQIEAGLLTYVPVENAFGPAAASFTFQVRDDGGLANGGTDLDLTPATMTIDIDPTNDAPVLVSGDTTATTITEDDTANAGQSVADLLGTITDIDEGTHASDNGTLQGMAIHGVGTEGNGGGDWQYSLDGGASWTDIALSEGEVLLLASDDMLRFAPDGENGTTAMLDYYAWDQATGESGDVVAGVAGDANLAARGEASAYSTGSGTVTLEVTDVNDAPTVTVTEVGTYYARGEAVALFGEDGISLSDVDAGDTLFRAEVVMNPSTTQDNAFDTVYETITAAGETFTAESGAVLTITGNGTAENPLVITGEGTTADYEEALAGLSYENANPNAFAGTRQVTVSVFDSQDAQSFPAFFSLDVEWSTVVDLNGAAEDRDHQVSYLENTPSVAIAASDAELVDQDGNTDQVVVTLTDAVNGSDERLYIDPVQLASFAALGVTVTGNGSHQITLNAGEGGLDPTYFQLVVRSIRYTNDSDAPTDAARHVEVTATDSDGNPGVSATTTINVQPVNDAPVSSLEVINTAEGRDITTPMTGDTLALAGELSDPDGIPAATLEWLRDGEVVQVGGDEYLLTGADAGHVISIRVSYLDGEGTEEVILTDATGTVINLVEGTEAADRLVGSSVGDLIHGFAENDTLSGGAGDDTLVGGEGSDTADYGAASAGVTADLSLEGAQEIGGGQGSDLFDGIENLTGSAHGDSLTGDDGANILTGASGDDTLLGGLGSDALYGNKGNDSLEGGDGDDWQHGGKGDDTVLGGAGDDTVMGGLGDDVLDGGEGFDVVDFFTATEGVSVNLSISGGQLVSLIEGTDSFVSIEGLSGSDYADSLIGDAAANWLAGMTGDDTLMGASGDDTVLGGEGMDWLYGNQGNDSLDGGDDNDWLHGGQGDDTVMGGAGDDTVMGGHGNDVLDGGEGFDVVDFFTATEGVSVDLSISGDQLVSLIEGTDSFIGIEGLSGSDYADTLSGDAAANWLAGMTGDDTLMGASGDDTVLGGEGMDWLYGNKGNDSLDGGDGNDWLHGGQGDDTVMGGAGDDTVMGGFGNDVLDGGEGFDVVDFFTATEGVSVNLSISGGQLVSLIEGTDSFIGIEGLSGSDYADSLIGDAAANWLAGMTGDDTLMGASGDDTVLGDEGMDWLYGNKGNDSLDGGDGNDWLHGGQGDDTVMGGNGDDTVMGGHGDDVIDGGEGFDGIDFFTATEGVSLDLSVTGPQFVSATEGTDTVTGIEVVYGSAFGDVLTAGDEGNGLAGQLGDDTLTGGAGNDSLIGGEGADVLYGGAGADMFGYTSAADGGDTILDFDAAEDVFVLMPGGFETPLVFGETVLWNGETGELSYDAGADSDPVLLATLVSDEEIFLTEDNFLSLG